MNVLVMGVMGVVMMVRMGVSEQWTHCSPPVSIHLYLRRRDNL